jgi:salicylate hydroxylase
MGIEDAAVLAKLFSHLTSLDQIQHFLYAFQELRQSRCRNTIVSEMGNLYFMALPDGEQQEQRNAAFREKYVRGLSPLGNDSSASEEWEMIKELFGYDAEDEADNWWTQWGLLRERAQRDRVDLGLQVELNIKVNGVS